MGGHYIFEVKSLRLLCTGVKNPYELDMYKRRCVLKNGLGQLPRPRRNRKIDNAMLSLVVFSQSFMGLHASKFSSVKEQDQHMQRSAT